MYPHVFRSWLSCGGSHSPLTCGHRLLYPLLVDDDVAARLTFKCCVPAGLAAVQAVRGAPGW